MPVPILCAESGYTVSENERNYIDNIEYNFIEYNKNYMSKDYYILNKELLSPLKEVILKVINSYREEICGIKQNLVITQSWITKTEIGGSHTIHNHPNSIFSGVYYIECSDSSPVNFYHGNELLRDFKFDLDYTKETIYNKSITRVLPKTGDIVMFPSWVEHDVGANLGPKKRIVLAFNTFLSGEFGAVNLYPTGLSL